MKGIVFNEICFGRYNMLFSDTYLRPVLPHQYVTSQS
jgi:hypothetical protein